MRLIPKTCGLAALALAASCASSGAVLGPSIDELEDRWVELDLFFET